MTAERRAPAPDARPALLDLDRAALEALLVDLGQPRYRAAQIWANVYRRYCLRFEEMTNLPVDLRAALAGRLRLAPATCLALQSSADGSTTKALLRLDDGELVEAVLMRYGAAGEGPPAAPAGRRTLCLSTQAGCAMGCVFCATGAQGFRRQLTLAEVLGQALTLARLAQDEGAAITNLVFMGMGEPLANYAVTSAALARLSDPEAFALSPRRLTVSTVGLVPGIRRLARDHPQVNLAVSLHAPTDALRRTLVPRPAAPLTDVIAAAREHALVTGRRVSFEYVLLAGVNDSPSQARALARRLRGVPCHVNLIPLNPSPGVVGERPARRTTLAFQAALREQGIAATVRAEKGRDIAAACGQLRGDRVELEAGGTAPSAAARRPRGRPATRP